MPTEKTITYTLYEFDELNDTAKEKARDWLRNTLFEDGSCYETVKDDAKAIGFELKDFDIDRGSFVEGEFTSSATECAASILKSHGENTATYKAAKKFDDAVKALPDANSEDARLDAFDVVEGEFLTDLQNAYLALLRAESDYLQSEEYIDEGIKINAYTFDETGKRKA